METKAPWQSKTMVVNALLGLASCVALFLPAAKGLADLLASNAPLVGAVWALLNIVLRAVTKEKISLTD
jgi:hypothetical protein